MQPSEFTRLVRELEERLEGPPPKGDAPAMSREELALLLAGWLLDRVTRKERNYGGT